MGGGEERERHCHCIFYMYEYVDDLCVLWRDGGVQLEERVQTSKVCFMNDDG